MGHQIESEAGVSVTRSKERLGCVRKTRVSCHYFGSSAQQPTLGRHSISVTLLTRPRERV